MTNGFFTDRFEVYVDRVDNAARDALEEAVEYGEELMVDFIETRGAFKQTKRVWTSTDRYGRRKSSPGRVASGRMVTSVKNRVKSVKGLAIGRFGWLDDKQNYFALQEQGFTHVGITREGDDGKVPGMFALRDASDLAFKKLVDSLRGKIRAI